MDWPALYNLVLSDEERRRIEGGGQLDWYQRMLIETMLLRYFRARTGSIAICRWSSEWQDGAHVTFYSDDSEGYVRGEQCRRFILEYTKPFAPEPEPDGDWIPSADDRMWFAHLFDSEAQGSSAR